MAYPTMNEMLYHTSRVRRRDAMHCMNLSSEVLRSLLRKEFDSLTDELKAKDRIIDMVHNARRYNLEARVFGFKIP